MAGSAKHTLFISYDGLSDPLGRSQVLPYLKGIAKSKKYIVHVVSLEKPGNASGMEAVTEICASVGIDWIPLTYNQGARGLSAFSNMRRLRATTFQLCKRYNVSVIHARSLLPARIAQKIASRFNIPFVFDMRGFWADERAQGGIWNMKNPVYRLAWKKYKRLENHLVRVADHVVVLTDRARNIIMQNRNGSGCTVIPCTVDRELFNPTVKNNYRDEQRKKLGISPERVVCAYSGSLGTWYLTDHLLDWFVEVKGRNPATFLLMIVSGNTEELKLKMASHSISKDDYHIISGVREEMPLLLATADVGVFFIKPVSSKAGSSPTKLAEFLSMGIPVISNTGIGDMDAQFTGNSLGYLVSKFSKEEYIASEKQLNDLLFRDKKEIIKFAEENYNLTTAINAYVSLYDELTRN